MHSFAGRALIAFTLLLAAGCGGGGGGVSPVAPAPGGAAVSRAPVTITVAIPRAAVAKRRRPSYVSAATKSVVLSGAAIGTPIVLDTTTNGGCTTSGTTTTCSASLQLPVGSTTITVKGYGSSGGTGTLLSTGSMTIDVVANTTSAFTATMDGVLASFRATLTPPSLTIGSPGTATFRVTGYDPSGAAILGSGNYADANDGALPVTVTLTDASGAVRFAGGGTTAVVHGPGDAPVGIAYSGGALPASA